MLHNGERERSGAQFPALILWLHSSREVDYQEGLHGEDNLQLLPETLGEGRPWN